MTDSCTYTFFIGYAVGSGVMIAFFALYFTFTLKNNDDS